jgi:hypothetical protein
MKSSLFQHLFLLISLSAYLLIFRDNIITTQCSSATVAAFSFVTTSSSIANNRYYHYYYNTANRRRQNFFSSTRLIQTNKVASSINGKNNDDNYNDRRSKSNVEETRKYLESSWNIQTMGRVPSTPESAAEAAGKNKNIDNSTNASYYYAFSVSLFR